MMKRLLACGALLAAPAFAAAGDEAGHWYLNPQVGAIVTDHDRDTHDDAIYGLGLGYNISKYFSAELNFNHAKVGDRFDSGNLKLDALSLDLLAVFNRAGGFAPYISVGGGAVQERPEFALDANKAMAEAGVGAMWKLWENSNASQSFSLRPDIKARFEDVGHGHTTDYIAMLGFQYSFGPGTAPPPVAAAPPPPPPAPPLPVQPSLPPPPLDSDHDGVPDNIDRCPGTPPGVAVDQFGCPEKGSITLEGVNFETNSSVLTADSRPILDEVAAGLVKHPRLRVELQGHTDSTGPKPYNMVLSGKRADAVRDYLLSKGVNSIQLVSKGYGPTEPVASNATKDGRAKNRRVVMSVLENPGDVDVKGAGTAEIK